MYYLSAILLPIFIFISSSSMASEHVLIGYFDCDVKGTSLMLPDDDGGISQYSKWEGGIGKADKIRLTYTYDILSDHFRFKVVDVFRDKDLLTISELYKAGEDERGRSVTKNYFGINRDFLNSRFNFSEDRIQLMSLDGNLRLNKNNALSWNGIITLLPLLEKYTEVVGVKCSHIRDVRGTIGVHFSKVYEKNFGKVMY